MIHHSWVNNMASFHYLMNQRPLQYVRHPIDRCSRLFKYTLSIKTMYTKNMHERGIPFTKTMSLDNTIGSRLGTMNYAWENHDLVLTLSYTTSPITLKDISHHDTRENLAKSKSSVRIPHVGCREHMIQVVNR